MTFRNTDLYMHLGAIGSRLAPGQAESLARFRAHDRRRREDMAAATRTGWCARLMGFVFGHGTTAQGAGPGHWTSRPVARRHDLSTGKLSSALHSAHDPS